MILENAFYNRQANLYNFPEKEFMKASENKINMRIREPKREIEFLAGRKACFRFECKACGRCCGEYTIVLTPYDIIRLRRATGRKTMELIREGIVRVTRMPFKKAFGFGPVADIFEMFGVSQNDTVPVALLGFGIDADGKSACRFLSEAQDGKRLCAIYEHRPGMCRLHPLGCATIGGRRNWFFRRPLCDSSEGAPQTVEGWLKASRMRPFLSANARYLRWMRELLDDPENLRKITERRWRALEQILFDFDSIKTNAKRVNMDAIEKMFNEWLSGTIPKTR